MFDKTQLGHLVMGKSRAANIVAPRKAPQQERSRQTYQLILRGAMEVLRRLGVQKFSTNKVAEQSGVSIGSLYQYFPSKESIMAALLDQCFERELENVKRLLEGLPPGLGARQVLNKVFVHYYLIPEDEFHFRKTIIEAVTAVGKNSDAIKLHRALSEIIVEYMQAHFVGPQGTAYHETRVFILQHMLRVCYLASVDTEFGNFKSGQLIEDLAGSVMGFLKVPQEHEGSVP